MSLGNKLTWYLLVGVLLVMGLDVYFSLTRTYTNLLDDVRREVAAISHTLRVSLEQAGDDDPQRYFIQLASEISGFENVLGVVFYDTQGQMATLSPSLYGRLLPEVDVRTVIATKIPIEGVFSGDVKHRYYRIEPIVGTKGQGIAAFLVIEDFPFFTRELRGRMLQAALTVLMLLIVLSAIVSIMIRQGVTQPLSAFTRRVEEIGEGQFEQRLHLTRRDEIGRLAQAFDRMCVRLEEAYKKLIEEGEENVRLERALRHSETLAALGQMASRLAHEIGTPLNVIQGRAEQLLRREGLTEKDRAFLGVIVAQIERISGFIRQLLTLARRPEPELRLANVNDIVRRAWEVMGQQERTDGVALLLDLADTTPPILGDPDQLQQVVLNLSVNATQAVGHTGRVTVRTRVRKNGDVLQGDSVEIEVADTGPGIAPAEQARVFEPFFTTKGMEGGTGLGLAICREIVLNHQGEIRVESEEGSGTRFIVSLPVVGAATDRLTPSVSLRKEKIHGNGIA
jgi:signal transduction histidine kinase